MNEQEGNKFTIAIIWIVRAIKLIAFIWLIVESLKLICK